MTITDFAITAFLWPLWQLAIATMAICAVGAILPWLVLHARLVSTDWAPHPPFHAGMIGMFALMLSFNVNDAWRRADGAYTALLRESQEVASMLPVFDALEGSGDRRAAEARTTLRTYLAVSLRDEWGRLNTRSSVEAGAALGGLRSASVQGMRDSGSPAALWRLIQDRVDGVQQARTSRLVAGGLYGDVVRWAVLICLYEAAAFAIAAVHLGRSQAAATALATFACVGAMMLVVVAHAEQPYAGFDAVEPDRLVEILAQLPP